MLWVVVSMPSVTQSLREHSSRKNSRMVCGPAGIFFITLDANVAPFGTECCHMCLGRFLVFIRSKRCPNGLLQFLHMHSTVQAVSFLQHGHLITVAYFFCCGIQGVQVVLSFFPQVHLEVSSDVSGEESGN